MSLLADVTAVVDGFTLTARVQADDGETVAIVGPNGAGKTTMLRALAGLLPLQAGSITLAGQVLDDPASNTFVVPEQRAIGVVFQDGLLFPHLRAIENVAFGLRARGVGKAKAHSEATVWLARVGLAGREHALPSQLSGGQAQRVALARALATSPALLLLDEPLASLDTTTRDEVRRDLRAHLATFAGVRVVVTHDPVDAAVLADRVVVLEEGRVAQVGTPAMIAARPRTPWVADLGGTNLFAGRATAGDVALDGGGTLAVADPMTSGPVFAAVQPRAVSLHRDRPTGSPRNVWAGQVSNIEPVGDRVRVRVAASPSIVAELTARAALELDLHVGSEVWVALKATEIDVYPA